MEEQFREDKQELKVWEQKKKAKDAKRIRGIVHEKDKSTGTNHVQDEMRKLTHHDEQALLSLCQGWHWDDTKRKWLDPELCAKTKREEAEYTLHHKMYKRVPRERRACVKRGKHPSRRDGWRLTRSNQGSPNVHARWVAKEYKTLARPELYASAPRLEALKVVLSEVATGKRGGRVVAVVDVRWTYFYAPSRRRVFDELPPEGYKAGDAHMCGLLRYGLYGTRDPHKMGHRHSATSS